ncbi:RluA family pseudouridine synthase [Paremcibacter congregatus]|uniref:Pseudouridine synthase n=1 Tax=Paremcibacter congregatus TaxID=2043170 RepID=A0A2G4YTI4_9PROT|nr:RluA family pseudouridine synthase [Paremcibacter congregatus]PHZ85648.1 RNA pseudouridine synthase [Paremcibacter congregatus]QDE26608.1 RluA family pseudouridine synthase [Paremcibacter congregatus]
MSGVTHQKVQTFENDWRLDKWFKVNYPDLGFGRLSKLLRTGQIRIDGKRVKASARLEEGMEIRIPPLGVNPNAGKPRPEQLGRKSFTKEESRAIHDMVIYQDNSVIVLNKLPGLAVQGGSKITRHVDGYLDCLQGDNPERPKLVHRLDKDTSGVLVIARTSAAAKSLTESFRNRKTKKIYWALVVGRPERSEGTINAPLDKEPGTHGERMMVADKGKKAVTDFHVMDSALRATSWVAFKPVTGRTHQIRVHATVLDTPIVGDGKYGGKDAFLDGAVSKKLHLHARSIDIDHPDGGLLQITAELPRHMKESWDMFGFDTDDRSDPFERDDDAR